MFSPTRALTVALAATVLIAACGSDDDTSADTTAGTTSAPETTVASTSPDTTVAETTPDTTTADTTPDTTAAPSQDVEADSAAAEAALITLAELPDGWTDGPAAGDAAGDVAARLAECVGVDSITSPDASAATGNFSNPDGSIVLSESVGVQATERDARMVVAGLTSPDVLDCLAGAYLELGAGALSAGAVADGAEIGAVVASRLPVGAAGDATQAIRVVVPASVDGVTELVTVDHVVARTGRSIAALTFEARGEPTPIETIDEIAATAASRLPV